MLTIRYTWMFVKFSINTVTFFSQHINQSLPASFRRAWFGVKTPEAFQENGWAQLKKREHQTKSWRSYRVTTHPTTKCRHLGVPTFLFGGGVYSNLNF